MAKLVPDVIPGDWKSLQRIINQLSSLKLGTTASPTFDSLTLSTSLTVPSVIVTGLTASRLISTDASKALASVGDLTSWVAGTANQIAVADDGDGTITLSTPQDIHVDAAPEWAGTVIKDSDDDIIFYVDDDELYFTAEEAAAEIATGNPIGLLLALTYTV